MLYSLPEGNPRKMDGFNGTCPMNLGAFDGIFIDKWWNFQVANLITGGHPASGDQTCRRQL